MTNGKSADKGGKTPAAKKPAAKRPAAAKKAAAAAKAAGAKTSRAGSGAEEVKAPTIRMRNISKRYGATVANDGIDLDLEPGEVHVLLGENGAGKTTLMEILYGFIPMDDGRIEVGGEVAEITSPHDALELGIGMVHQHFMLVLPFTVAENVVLGVGGLASPHFPKRRYTEEVQAAADRYNLELSSRQRCADLGSDGKQRVEILRLLYRGAKVLVLDEPTAALGPRQIETLFETLRALADSGHSILMVTHKLNEVLEIADKVTVIRTGTRRLHAKRGEFDAHKLAIAMTGQELPEMPEGKAKKVTEAVLEVDALEVVGQGDADGLRGISFGVGAGEILGVAGVAGNGQMEIEEALGGVREIEAGHVRISGNDVTGAEPGELHRAGMRVVPSDRHEWGLILDMNLAENLGLSAVPGGRFVKRGVVQWKALRAHASELLKAYDVRPPDPDLMADSLSGGNQQKLVLARELERQPPVFVAANPTQGLDIGAADAVRRRLLEAKENGSAILLISQDIEELLTLSDRVIVISRGTIAYESDVDKLSGDEFALAMGGQQREAVPA